MTVRNSIIEGQSKMKMLWLVMNLFLAVPAIAQQSDINYRGSLNATCSTATANCGNAMAQRGAANAGSAVEVPSTGYGIATVTVSGTYSGSTINFEFSDDGGVTYYSDTCSRTDAAIQELSEVLPTNQVRAWECGTVASTSFRVRQSANSTGAPSIGITLSAASIEPAATVAFAAQGTQLGNACMNAASSMVGAVISLSGTAATQFIAAVAGQKIYFCGAFFGNGGGTTPTLSLQYGTGTNCGTGTVTILPAVAIPAGTATPIFMPQNFFATPASQAACFILTGTAPTGTLTVNTIQQ